MADQKDSYEELREQKEARRRALMSDTELKEAERYLQWYRKAYQDKVNLGVTKKWEDISKYWEGDFEYEDDTAPAPNTNITNSNVEGKTALLCDQNISMQVDPREPGDRFFCDKVRILADFIKERNKMYRKIEVHERRREMTGTGILRVLWDFNALDEKGLPNIEPVHPSRLFIDPAITDVYKIQEAQYIIEARNKSIYSAEIEYGEEVAEAIMPNLDPVSNVIVNNEEEQYVHLMIWTRYKENDELKLRLIEMSGCGVILKDTKKKLKERKDEGKDDIEIFPNSKYPYFITPDMYRENTVWGKASAELILPLSDQIDEIDDSIIRNIRLVGNPMGIVSNNSGIDVGKITNEPGQMIPSNDINGFKWVTPPSMQGYVTDKRAELMNNDRQVVTRFTDQSIGKQQSGVDTATEALALQNSGNSMIEHKKGLLQETLSDVFEYALELALLNWDTTMIFRITGDNGQDDFVEFNPDKLNHIPVLIESDTEYRNKYKKEWQKRNPSKDISELDSKEYQFMQSDTETRKIRYDLTVSVGAGLPNNRAYRYSIIRQAYVDKAISKKEYRDYLIKQLGLNIPEIPDSTEEQQELGIYSEQTLDEIKEQAQGINQSANIEGLSVNGNPQTSYMKGV